MFKQSDLRREEEKNITVGLDIGTSKIGTVVGEVGEGGRVQILGVGISPSQGLRQGVVINLDQAVASIQQAVQEAQLTAGVEIVDVIVGIAGDHIRSVNSRGVVAVARNDHEITQSDVDRVIDAAKAIALPIDREVLHVLPQEFIVDTQTGIKNPVGITGVRLEAEVHIVTGAVTSAQNIIRSVKKAGLRVSGLVLEPLASSYSILDKNEKDLGVAIIDLGGGTTDIALFYEGAIRHTAVIGLGGQNVTNDIALGLRTPIEQAEEIKKKVGCTYQGLVSKNEMFTVPGIGGRAAREVSRELLTTIIQPRMEEIFSLAAKEIKRSEFGELLSAGVVITGGGSLLHGVVPLAEEVFGLPAKIGIPQGIVGLIESASSPIFATGVGLIFYGLDKKNKMKRPIMEDESGLFGRVLHWMRHLVEDFF